MLRSEYNSSRCLDYIFTNRPEACKEAKIDNELIATPYCVVMEDGQPKERRFSDHKTVMASFDFKKASVKKFKKPAKFIKFIQRNRMITKKNEQVNKQLNT